MKLIFIHTPKCGGSYVSQILSDLNITKDQIVQIRNFKNIENFENGYVIEKRDILTNDMIQVLTISKKIAWTDGTIRPAYGGLEYEVYIYLNIRL